MQQRHSPQKLILKALLLVLTVSFVSCSTDEPTFSRIPAIKFKSITKYTIGSNVKRTQRDSVVISITFKDGDGDLGEDVRDTTRLNQTFANQPWGNYQIRTFQFVGGKFEEVSVAANSRLFFPQTATKRGPLEGVLDFTQRFPYQSTIRSVPIKFQIRLRDRQLNESNIIETDTVNVPLI